MPPSRCVPEAAQVERAATRASRPTRTSHRLDPIPSPSVVCRGRRGGRPDSDVKSHAVSNATATVMPGDREARKAKPLHDDHHVLCHGALRIWCMVLGRGRTTAAPIATQIGADYRKVTGKHRRDAAPHEVCLRKTVQQEDRRPGAGPARKDTGLARLDLSSLEVIHHCKSSEPKGYLMSLVK